MKTDSFILILAILGSSFWGSWHCAAMCGPIASLAARRNSLTLYHLGRLLSYSSLGAIGGFVGSFFLSSEFEVLRIGAGWVFASLLIIMGIQTLRGNKTVLSPQSNWFHSIYASKSPGFILGLISIFLPCGWLYSYALAAVATKSSWSGALLMILFWIAGLPALNTVSLFMKKSIQIAPKRKQFIAGVVLTFAGVYSLISFYLFSNHSH